MTMSEIELKDLHDLHASVQTTEPPILDKN